MSRVSEARNQLDAWEAQKPAPFKSDYEDKMKDTNAQLTAMGDFSYDPTRDAAYEQYKNRYTRQAKLANENAQANASAISGGYGSSYGTQAGQSAYQNAMNGLNNAVNGLYDQALNQYTQKKSDLGDQYDRYYQAYTQEKNLYDTNYQNWQNQLAYYQNEYNQAVAERQNNTSNGLGFLGTLVRVGLGLLPYL